MFCSNITPSLSSGKHRLKLPYSGLTLTSDWNAQEIWNIVLFRHTPLAHLVSPGTWKSRYQVPAPGTSPKTWHVRHSWIGFSKCSPRMLKSGRLWNPVKSYGSTNENYERTQQRNPLCHAVVKCCHQAVITCYFYQTFYQTFLRPRSDPAFAFFTNLLSVIRSFK